MRTPLSLVLSSLVLGCLAAPARAEDPSFIKPVSVGASAPDFFALPTSAALKQTATPAPCAPVMGSSACENDWSGFYVGVNGGWGLSSFLPEIIPVGPTANADFRTHDLRHPANGALVGGQIGYNWQFGNFVVGIEGDFDPSKLTGDAQLLTPSLIVPALAINGFSTSDTINWVASVRGRVGYSFGPALLYGTAGISWEDLSRVTMVNAEIAPAVFGVSTTSNVTTVRQGYVLGGGLEYMLTNNWILRGEYLYNSFTSLSNDTAPFASQATPSNAALIRTGHNEIHEIRVGISYKF